MRVQIRKGVFETNSSSIHTLTIARGTPLLGRYKGSLFYVSETRDYGWMNAIYSDFEIKLDYLVLAFEYASFIGTTEEEQIKSLEQTKAWRKQLQEILNKYDIEIRYDYNKVVWFSHNNNLTKYWEFVPDYYNGNMPKPSEYRKGCIDHGDELREFVQDIMVDEELLLGFLFNFRSYIRTGHDNQGDEELIPLPEVENIYKFVKEN